MHSVQLFTCQNCDLRQCAVPLPHVVLAQPGFERYRILTKRQTKHWISKVQGERIRLGLFVEYSPPLFMPKARLIVVEGPRKISHGGLPTRSNIPGPWRVVCSCMSVKQFDSVHTLQSSIFQIIPSTPVGWSTRYISFSAFIFANLHRFSSWSRGFSVCDTNEKTTHTAC